ncbi:MAG: Dabb family protein [Clostridia bacterium]|nr:Dabb family protein [Clostridia bacterium]
MIRHVVMWKLKECAEGKTKRENLEYIRELLYSLPPLIPQIKHMEIAFDLSGTDASMDLMLLTEFNSMDDLRTYAVHPEHLKVSDYVKKAVEVRAVLDCEI